MYLSLGFEQGSPAPSSAASGVEVTYGSIIKLMHEKTKFRLHSQDLPYGSGSAQQSVTGFTDVDDANSYWSTSAKQGDSIKSGTIICLQHMRTRKWLHSHLHVAPITGNLEALLGGMETGEDEFGELYCDVLQPFSPLPSPKINNAEPETCSKNSEEKEVLGTVKLEIYLGSRRVLKNNFVFSLAEFNQSENLGDGGDELNSVPGDSNSDLEVDGKASGTLERHGTDISLDGTSSYKMQEICTGAAGAGPCKDEPSEEGELSEHADQDFNREMVTVAGTEARINCNMPPNNSPLKNARHVEAATFNVEALMPQPPTTTLNNFRYKPQVQPRRPTVTRYPYLSTSVFDLDMDCLEHRPWRHPSVDLSNYFNYGLTEASWKSYCDNIKTMRRYTGKQIQVENGYRDHPPSEKAIPQRPRESTATIQIVAQDKASLIGLREEIKCGVAPPELVRMVEGSCSSKRAKILGETSRDSTSNMSANEWMCRNVGMDSWSHPITNQETDKKVSRKGRSKLERWTRHDRDNDDENTSSSSL